MLVGTKTLKCNIYLEGQNQISIPLLENDAVMRMRIHKYYLFSRWL
jgi:hypothetical protein